MFNNSFFEDLSSRLSAIIPLGEEVRDDLRTKIEQLLKSSFASLDLLSREEFDTQRQALDRAEQRIKELEQSLTKLGKKFELLEGQSTSP
ncbi:MAG: accessory factor UbiK family protein [Gammaproteobacteria bacterium]|nr:accessory factor UbiK family protein [Gammaproteobacteria bacterium]MDG2337774.1 accessory factor UbiK family protein [Gammaproteobacteria bacterium]